MSTPKALQERQFRSTSTGRFWEKTVVGSLATCALITVLITIGIISMLISQSWGFFASESVTLQRFPVGQRMDGAAVQGFGQG